MTDQQTDNAVSDIPQQAQNQPAIGIVVTEDVGDAVAGTILRARRSDCHTLVTYRSSENMEGIRFAEQLGATVVDPPEWSREISPRDVLRSAARERGFPGLIYQNDLTERIDIDASIRQLERDEAYAIDATLTHELAVDSRTLVAIPAYNEADTINEIVTESLKHADTVLVVDDGSRDDTAQRARESGAKVIEHIRNQGYGGALMTAFGKAVEWQVDHLVTIDADGQHHPADIPDLLRAQQETDADIVIGSRFVNGSSDNVPRYRKFGITVMNILTNMTTGDLRSERTISDTQSGFRAYGVDVVQLLATADGLDHGMGISTDILYYARENGYEIDEIEVEIDHDVENANSQNPVRHGLRLVNNLLKIIERERPILFFSIPGLFSLLIGIGVGAWGIEVYLRNNTYPFGLILLSTLLVLVGIFSAFTGLILHGIARQFD